MKGKRWIIVGVSIVVVILIALVVYFRRKGDPVYFAKRGEVVELSFELDKKLEFGEYYFGLENGKGSTYPLCFCLTEKNTYPPNCSGDVKYLYKNTPGTMCIPVKIGSGRCSVSAIETMGYATNFIIPLEYSWTKPFQKIVLGIQVPRQAPEEAVLAIDVMICRQNIQGKMERSRLYEKKIVIKSENAK
jgi:hypothetical protein